MTLTNVVTAEFEQIPMHLLSALRPTLAGVLTVATLPPQFN